MSIKIVVVINPSHFGFLRQVTTYPRLALNSPSPGPCTSASLVLGWQAAPLYLASNFTVHSWISQKAPIKRKAAHQPSLCSEVPPAPGWNTELFPMHIGCSRAKGMLAQVLRCSRKEWHLLTCKSEQKALPPSPHLLLGRSLKYHSALGRKDPFVPKLFPSKSPAESAPFFCLQPLLLPTLKTIFCKPKIFKTPRLASLRRQRKSIHD